MVKSLEGNQWICSLSADKQGSNWQHCHSRCTYRGAVMMGMKGELHGNLECVQDFTNYVENPALRTFIMD